jgi:hypothetical protein
MKHNYKVRHQLEMRMPTRIYKKGETITAKDLDGLNVEALIMSGWLRDEGVDPVPCPACIEQKVKSPPKLKSLEDAQAHYSEKHPALAAPETEEDLNDG